MKINKSIALFVRDTIYGLVRFKDWLFPTHKPHIIIFAYHSISDDEWRFSVRAEEFKRQVEYLLKTHTPIKASEIPAYINEEKKIEKNMFVLMFDDGYADILSIKAFLYENKIFPTAFLIADSKKANRAELETKRGLLTHEQIRELVDTGWEIGSHSSTHADFSKLSKEEILKEILDSKNILERELGIRIKYFAYPKGYYNDEIVRAVERAGYDLAFSMDDGYLDSKTNKFLIPRIGVDGTHKLLQFKSIYSPGAIFIRGIIKKVLKTVNL